MYIGEHSEPAYISDGQSTIEFVNPLANQFLEMH